MAMQNIHLTDAEAFYRFLAEQLGNGDRNRSPEDLLAVWRAEHPSSEELEEGIAAVKESLADMEAGDRGRPAREVVQEFRSKHNLHRDA